MSLKHNIEIDFTPLREAEARATVSMEITRKINMRIKSLGEELRDLTDAFSHYTYAQILVTLNPELNLELSDYWLYLSSNEIRLDYRVGKEGLTPLVPIMKQLREDYGKPTLVKNDMMLTWEYRNKQYKKLELRIVPGPEAKCEKVKVGEKILEEKTLKERIVDVMEVQCEGAEDLADLANQDQKEIENWEERITGNADMESEPDDN